MDQSWKRMRTMASVWITEYRDRLNPDCLWEIWTHTIEHSKLSNTKLHRLVKQDPEYYFRSIEYVRKEAGKDQGNERA